MVCVSGQFQAKAEIGYAFDPIPSAARRDFRLKPIDHLILAVLVSFAIWRRDSCWASIATIAARLPALRSGRSGSTVASHRTVQRSLDRLKACGYIRHERVAKPDLDDPRNLTGWRFYFNFAPVQTPALERPALPTSKSPDSLVTQDEIEVLKPDRTTFNVVNGGTLAQEGDEKAPPVKPAPIVELNPRSQQPAVSVWTPAEHAERFFRRLRDRGLILKVEVDAERGEVIRTYPQTKFVEPIQPDEVAELLRLRPHVLAFLKGTVASPVATGQTDPAFSKPGRRVPEVVQAQTRCLIGRLAGNAEPAIEAMVCRSIADALNDHNPTSLALFLGLAGDVRRKSLAEGCLQEAFEAACGRGVENRGAMFTAVVKRWRRAAKLSAG
jgi:hypothetical protein